MTLWQNWNSNLRKTFLSQNKNENWNNFNRRFQTQNQTEFFLQTTLSCNVLRKERKLLQSKKMKAKSQQLQMIQLIIDFVLKSLISYLLILLILCLWSFSWWIKKMMMIEELVVLRSEEREITNFLHFISSKLDKEWELDLFLEYVKQKYLTKFLHEFTVLLDQMFTQSIPPNSSSILHHWQHKLTQFLKGLIPDWKESRKVNWHQK